MQVAGGEGDAGGGQVLRKFLRVGSAYPPGKSAEAARPACAPVPTTVSPWPSRWVASSRPKPLLTPVMSQFQAVPRGRHRVRPGRGVPS
jgi:hypothetical protein